MTPPFQPARSSASGGLSAAHAPLSVLVAEDTPANQKAIASILRKLGHRVTVAEDGQQALQQVSRENYDLVLMDLEMPVMDGYQAATAIRELETATGKHTPIIALSAHAAEHRDGKDPLPDMDGYLAKPIDVSELASHLDAITKQSKQIPAQGKDGVVSGDLSETPTAALMDLAATMDRLGGDRKLLGEFIDVFREDAPKLLEELRMAVQRQDIPTVVRATHSLKGLAANFNATRVVEAASLFETVARRGQTVGAEELLEQLSLQVSRLVSALEVHRKS